MNKKQWKIFYRKIRVARREVNKASIGMLLHGNGFVLVPADCSDVKYIPVMDVIIKATDEDNKT